MNRFFVDKSRIDGKSAVIVGDDVAHISRVLRLAPGDEVMLCDGACTDYLSRIEGITRDEVTLSIVSSEASETEPPCRVTLFQGVPKAGKLDTIIQKCVELGVFAICPVTMERSVAKLEADDKNKLTRLLRISCEAAKQSRRGMIPAVLAPVALKKVDFSGFDAVIVAYEDERATTLKARLTGFDFKNKNIAIVVGPEGGFDESEIELLRSKDAFTVSLGRRILRTETAGMAMLAMLMYEAEG